MKGKERKERRTREQEREQEANERTLTLFLFLSSPSLRSFSSQECSFPQESYTSSSSPFLSLFTHFFHLAIFSLSNLLSVRCTLILFLCPTRSSISLPPPYIPYTRPSPLYDPLPSSKAHSPPFAFLLSLLVEGRTKITNPRGICREPRLDRGVSLGRARTTRQPSRFLPRCKCLTLARRIIKEIMFELRIYIRNDSWNEMKGLNSSCGAINHRKEFMELV